MSGEIISIEGRRVEKKSALTELERRADLEAETARMNAKALDGNKG